jgi:hypothetical protein
MSVELAFDLAVIVLSVFSTVMMSMVMLGL